MGSAVYSLVARIPFTPVDLDIGRLARGEWDPLKDRFRFWFIPTIKKLGDGPVCNFTIRKFDPDGGVLLFMHLTANHDATIQEDQEADSDHFVLGILCNDDVRARAALGSVLDIPPSFHRRKEVRLIESRWRRDSPVTMYFLANVHSVMSAGSEGPRASFKVEGTASEEILATLKDGMKGWWRADGPRSPEEPPKS